MNYNVGEANPNWRHGRSHDPVYKVWLQMRDRCRNPNNERWDDYGGRGITVCKRWHSFENFAADMGPRPEGASLERKNNDWNYNRRNCIWATPQRQAGNRRNNRWITIGRRTMVAADWARYYGLTYNTFAYRYRVGRLT